MNYYPGGSFDGQYVPLGNPNEADCVIGHEFGYRQDGFGLVNEALAQFIADNYLELPLLLNRNIAGALAELAPEVEPTQILDGASTNYLGTKGAGTLGELVQARQTMQPEGLKKPLIVAQAYHVGRVSLHAVKAGIKGFIVPEGLPHLFDPESEQAWTRSPEAWAKRERIAVIGFRALGLM